MRRRNCATSGAPATYARRGTAVAYVISELPGERAEALFIAMAALVPTAGEQFTPELRARVARYSVREIIEGTVKFYEVIQ